MSQSTRARVALPLAAALALAATAATAQERSPYYIGISQAFSYDSNIFRTASNEISETISSTGVLAGFDQPLGRQRAYADVSAQVNRYRSADHLDNKSYGVTAGLDWQTVQFLSGSLRFATRNSLADFGTLEGGLTPSDQTTRQLLASARYGFTSRLSFDASYENRSLKYRSDAYANRNYTQDTIGAGFVFGGTGRLTFGIAARGTRGTTPQYQPTPPYEDELDRRDIDLTARWAPSGLSMLSLRVSSTKETHTLATNAEVSAITGALAWEYQPTAKIDFRLMLSRDTGTETTFSMTAPSGSAPLRVDNSRLSNMGEVSLRYAMTSKIALGTEARYRRGTSQAGGRETLSAYGANLSYNPTRSSTLSCTVLQERRDAQASAGYSALTGACSAQLTLR